MVVRPSSRPLLLLSIALGCSPAPPVATPQSLATATMTAAGPPPPTPVRWTFNEGAVPPGTEREGKMPEALVSCELPSTARERFLTGPLREHDGALAQLGGSYWLHRYDIGQEGRCRIDTAGPLLGDGGEADGAVSLPVVASAPRYVSFLAGGGGGELTSVELCVQRGAECKTIRSARGPGRLGMERIVWDLEGTGAMFSPVKLRIVDRSSQAKGRADYAGRRFLMIDDVVFSSEAPGPSRPPPAWGFADLHAHLFNHLGFGGHMIHGGVNGPMKTDLASCGPNHTDVVTPEGITYHNQKGYPTFKDWPKFGTKAHQQAHADWIKRAYLGGLRLIQVDVGNSKTFRDAYTLFHDDPNLDPSDDKSVIERQLRAVRAFVLGPAKEWAAIATTPAEARSILAAGKLVLVLGAELDRPFEQISGAVAPGAPPEDAVRSYVAWLKREGIRHYFPVHIMENVFSSPAVYSRLFYVAGKYETHKWLGLESGSADGIRYDVFRDKEENTARILLQYLPRLLRRRSNPAPPDPPDPQASVLASAADPAKSAAPVRGYIRGPHRAAGGLTPLGRILLKELMRAGMIVDLSHMSQRGRAESLQMAAGYPLQSSHTGMRDVLFGNEEPKYLPDGGYEITVKPAPYNARDYHTSKIGKVVSEASLSKDEIRLIHDGGGVVGLGLGSAADGISWRGRVPLDCDGTAKSFAQRYLYALDVLRRDGEVRGLAIGTDVNGFAGLPPPRFGQHACHDGMEDAERKRDQHPERQKTPVLYDVPPVTPSILAALDKYRVPRSASAPEDRALIRYRVEEGGRDFDVNVEGVAHYGLLPDFLQDVVIVGVTPEEMGPLFHGAEDYIRMWERIEARAAELSKAEP